MSLARFNGPVFNRPGVELAICFALLLSPSHSCGWQCAKLFAVPIFFGVESFFVESRCRSSTHDNLDFKTATIDNSLAPEWNETFHIAIVDPNATEFRFTIRNRNTFRTDDFMGDVTVRPQSLGLKKGQPFTAWFPLNVASAAGAPDQPLSDGAVTPQLKLSFYSSDVGQEDIQTQPHPSSETEKDNAFE